MRENVKFPKGDIMSSLRNGRMISVAGLFFLLLSFTFYGCGAQSASQGMPQNPGNIPPQSTQSTPQGTQSTPQSAPQSATDKSVTLSWDPVTENLAGGALAGPVTYRVYYGTQSYVYNPPIDVGGANSYTFGNLKAGTTYYFTVTAVDKSTGKESPISKELVKTF